MNDRKCLQCYEQLRGRADQKFCNDQCRSTYNNIQYLESNNVVKTINRILKKNYSILIAFDALGKTTVKKSDLERKGYRFDHYTHFVTSRTTSINYFCYDHGYREQDVNKLVLLNRDISQDPSLLRN